MKTKIRRRVSLLTGQLLILLLLIGLVELGLWLFFPILNNQYNEVVMTQSLPGLKPEVVYRATREGLRSTSEVAERKPADLIRVLCLGASTTEQTTQETPDTWCGLLEANLREQFDDQDVAFQTMAFGKGGLRAVDDAAWVVANFDRLAPDIVVTLLGINDLMWNGGDQYQYPGFDARLAKAVAKVKGPAQSDAKRLCLAYSQLCRRAAKIMTDLDLKQKMGTGEIVAWTSANIPKLRERYQALPYAAELQRDPDPIVEFGDAVEWLTAFFKEKGVELILLGQPVLWHDDITEEQVDKLWFSVATPQGPVRPPPSWLHREMARYNAVQHDAASRHEAVYLDLDAVVPKSLDVYFDDCHFTDAGSRVVADEVTPLVTAATARVMQQRGLQPEPRVAGTSTE